MGQFGLVPNGVESMVQVIQLPVHLLVSIQGHLPKYLIRHHPLHRLNNLPRHPLLGTLKKVSLQSWIQYLQQVHLPKSQKLQRSVVHAKNMALWADMVTNPSMATSLKMTITSLKMAIINLLSMDWYLTMEHLSTVETTVTVKVTDTRITNLNPATEVTAAIILSANLAPPGVRRLATELIQALLDKKEKVSRFIFVLMIFFSTVILNILS